MPFPCNIGKKNKEKIRVNRHEVELEISTGGELSSLAFAQGHRALVGQAQSAIAIFFATIVPVQLRSVSRKRVQSVDFYHLFSSRYLVEAWEMPSRSGPFEVLGYKIVQGVRINFR